MVEKTKLVKAMENFFKKVLKNVEKQPTKHLLKMNVILCVKLSKIPLKYIDYTSIQG